MSSFELIFGSGGWSGLLLRGAVVTVLLSVVAAPFGFGGGLVLALLRSARFGPMRRFCGLYVWFFRGVPDLLSLFLIYFGLQALLTWVGGLTGLRLEMNAFAAGVIALSVVVAAYSSEVWVGARAAVPLGQVEAARSLGMRPRLVFRFVVMPQMVRIALPGLGNVWMVLIKETSLISTLAVTDLLRAASEASRATSRPILFYVAAGSLYLAFSLVSWMGQSVLERRVGRGLVLGRT